MSGTKRVYKTVAFYEVLDEHDQPLEEAANWQSVLSDLDIERVQAGGSIDALSHEFNGAVHYAQIYTDENGSHFVLAKERDEPPSSIDRSTGELLDEEMDANRPWVEVSVISFMPNSNVFGFVLGSGASPRASALAEWLNRHEVFDQVVSIGPHVSDELVQRLRDSDTEASLVHLRMSASQIMSESPAEGLYSRSRRFARELDLGPEVDVEITLKIGGRADHASEGTRLQMGDLGRELVDSDLAAAEVEIVDTTDGSTDRELVDLIEQRMATKERISILDSDGGTQVRIPSALLAISRAQDKLNILG